MPGLGEVVAVIAVVLAVLVTLRLAVAGSAWLRRTRRPETRSIRVVGVGGGGSNAVDRMVDARIRGVGFVALNTDAQALRRSRAGTKLRIGTAVTGGLGSGGDPEVGRKAAEEDAEWIERIVAGADLVFVTAGLGGGTGSGAAPLVAAAARKQGALTVAVVTKPFAFEGTQRRRIAEAAAAELGANVDALIVVPNDRVADVIEAEASMATAFAAVDDVLLQAVRGIIDLIAMPGVINLDFADIRSVMKDAGPALIGIGRGSGDRRATDAARAAIGSPLLEAQVDGAKGILFNISGPDDLRLSEIRSAADEIARRADPDANVIFGTSYSTLPGDDVLVTLIATGLTGLAREVSQPSDAADALAADPQPVAAVLKPPEPAKPRPDDAPPTGRDSEPARPAAAAAANASPVSAERPARPRTRQLKPRSSADRRPALKYVADEEVEVGDVEGLAARADDDDLDVPSFLRRRVSSDRD